MLPHTIKTCALAWISLPCAVPLCLGSGPGLLVSVQSSARTALFDSQPDYELLTARALGHDVEQQSQRDGAGIANATVVEGVAYFLRAVDLRPGVEDIPSLVISLRTSWLELPVASFNEHGLARGTAESFANDLLRRGFGRSASAFR